MEQQEHYTRDFSITSSIYLRTCFCFIAEVSIIGERVKNQGSRKMVEGHFRTKINVF